MRTEAQNEVVRAQWCSWCDDPATHQLSSPDFTDYGCDHHTRQWKPFYPQVRPLLEVAS